MTASADLVPGEFVKIALHRTVTSFFTNETAEQTWWVFARYVSTVDQQVVIEHADGTRSLVDAINVHPLEPANSEPGGAT